MSDYYENKGHNGNLGRKFAKAKVDSLLGKSQNLGPGAKGWVIQVQRNLVEIIRRAHNKRKDEDLYAHLEFQEVINIFRTTTNILSSEQTKEKIVAALCMLDHIKKDLKINTIDEGYFEAALEGSGKINMNSGITKPLQSPENTSTSPELQKLLYL